MIITVFTVIQVSLIYCCTGTAQSYLLLYRYRSALFTVVQVQVSHSYCCAGTGQSYLPLYMSVIFTVVQVQVSHIYHIIKF